MPDISKCKNETCSLKETCYRFQVPANTFRQSYGSFEQDKEGKCEYYWEFKIEQDGKSE